MNAFICTTCGTQFPPAGEPPTGCAICLDERQYLGHAGQQWTTMAELSKHHTNRIEELEPGLHGIGTMPSFGIDQRALLVQGLMWDCITFLDEATAQEVERIGGIKTIAISHPHYYAAMVDWADRFDARILLHEADRSWVIRPSGRIEFWTGERIRISDELELLRLGGHFEGSTVCLWQKGADGQGALLSGDTVHVVSDRDWVSFMYSYPNLIPLPAHEVQRIRSIIDGLAFERVYGAWWDRVVLADAKAKVLRSADRYLKALSPKTHP